MRTIAWLCVIPGAAAAGPTTLVHQGRLLDAGGVPLNGAFPADLALYPSEGSTSSVWAESETLSATDGYYAVLLGDVTPLTPAVLAAPELWLALAVDGVELSRQRLSSVPYAISAAGATTLTRADCADGQVLAWDATSAAWACATVALSSATVDQLVLAPQATAPAAVEGLIYNDQASGALRAYVGGAWHDLTPSSYTYRYWRVRFLVATTGHSPNTDEIRWFDGTTQHTPTAVTCNGNQSTGVTCAGLVDSSTNCSDIGRILWDTTANVVFDFGTPKTVDRVQAHTSYTGSRGADWAVEGSADGLSWTNLATFAYHASGCANYEATF